MKKAIFVLVLVFSVLLVFSCKTTTIDDTFRAIYDRHFRHLILDGAGSHTVQSQQTLYLIAQSIYGEGYYYPVIMLASRDVVLDPNNIRPGMVLTVPNLQVNLENPTSRAAVKGVILDCADIEEARGWTQGAERLRALANSL